MSITITQGDILDAGTDALVNPANSFLNHAGGLAGIIARAAAPMARFATLNDAYHYGGPGDDLTHWQEDSEWVKDNAQQPLVPVGAAVASSPGRLADRGFKTIIHAVGPIWGDGRLCEPFLLLSAHNDAITAAADAGATSVAIPAISCEIFGYPVEKAAPIALDAAVFMHGYLNMNIKFVLFSDEHFQAYQEAAGRIGLSA